MFVFHSFYAACVWVEDNANGPVGVLHSATVWTDANLIPYRREVLYPDWESTRF